MEFQPEAGAGAAEQLTRFAKNRLSKGPLGAPFFAVLLVTGLALGACSPLKVINWLVPGSTYEVRAGLEYGADPRQKLDVYRPRPATDTGTDPDSYPVVVFFHGGNWTTGNRAAYKFIGEALASRGILAVVAGFRVYPDVRFPDFLADCARATAWAAREAPRFGGDPRRLFLMGHSSGAYDAAMLALDPRWLSSAGVTPSGVAGWIGLAGPYDFFPMQDPKSQPVFHHPDYPRGALPIDHVSASAPRAFLGTPAEDDLVDPARNTLQLADKLRSAGADVTLKVYPGVSHYTLIGAFARPLRGLAPVLDDVAAFVHATPAPPPT